MNNPLVSILIPVYNVEAYLPQCLDSVLGQTYKNLQIVLIDDGSKDDSWKIMQDYAAKDARIEIYHQENQGVAATRNHLLEKIKGEYVLFVDSDDWVEGDMVCYLVELAKNHNSAFVMCERMNDAKKPKECSYDITILTQEQGINDFLRHDYFCGALCNKLLSSKLLKGTRFQENITYGEDALFCWAIMQKISKIIITKKQLYHYRMTDNSLSHRKWSADGKGSSHEVWKQISEDTQKKWPQYLNIAIGAYAIADMWNIFFAAKDCYKFDNYILQYQQNIRKHLGIILKYRLINWKGLIFAFIASRSYAMTKLMVRFI